MFTIYSLMYSHFLEHDLLTGATCQQKTDSSFLRAKGETSCTSADYIHAWVFLAEDFICLLYAVISTGRLHFLLSCYAQKTLFLGSHSQFLLLYLPFLSPFPQRSLRFERSDWDIDVPIRWTFHSILYLYFSQLRVSVLVTMYINRNLFDMGERSNLWV